MRLHRRTSCTLLFLIVFVSAPAFAGVETFVEDFSTSTYQDVSNTSAYWATGAGELKLWGYDPNEVATFAVTSPQDVIIDGANLYVVNTTELHWYDISTPASPESVLTVSVLTNARGLDAVGKYIYVADGTAGLTILNTGTLTIVGSVGTAGIAEQVEVVGGLAYVALGTSGLDVIDVSDPTTPVSVGAYNTSGISFELDVEGNYCYVADYNGGLAIIDISDPTSPSLATTFAAGGSVANVVIEGNVAYLSDNANGLVSVDISDPTSPSLLNNIPGQVGRYVVVAGNLAYLARAGGILEIDVSSPSSLSPTANVPTGGNNIYSMATDGEYLYQCDAVDDVIRVVEVQEPSPLNLVKSYDPGTVERLELRGNILYAGSPVLYAIDVSNPLNPIGLDNLTLSGDFIEDFDVEGDFVYLAALLDGLCVVDVSDPTAMAIAGTLSPIGSGLSETIEVLGDLCLLGNDDNTDQLRLIDVSDPTSPVSLSAFTLAGTPVDIEIEGHTAFIALSDDGLDIVDITNPLVPSLIAHWDPAGNVRTVLVEGELMYRTTESDGVYIIDFTNLPSSSTPGFVFADGSFTNGLAKTGTYLFTSADGDGLRMYDVADPYSPIELEYGYGHNASSPREIAAAGQHVYQATKSDGLDVFKVMAGDFELENNMAQSIIVDNAADSIFAVRLTSQHTGAPEWSLSVDAGVTWDAYPTEGVWQQFPTPGSNLRWAVSIVQSEGGVNPTIDQLELNMAFEHPVVTNVEDIANDQGRQVRVVWQFSAYDMPGSVTPILNYAVYRWIDPNLSSIASANLVVSPEGIAATPAGWDFVGLVPATVEDEYSLVVPTLADSTISSGDYNTSFYVRALTASPATYFDSPPDSGYSVDNLAPMVPASFVIAYNTGSGNTLTWDEAPETDFQFFRIYRSSDPSFTPTPGDLVHSTTSTGWVDPDNDGGPVYYTVTATDFSGNESDAASAGTVSSIPDEALPDRWTLHGNVPNPFNPTTEIRYSVPAGGGEISLRIYDARGRFVRGLVEGRGESGREIGDLGRTRRTRADRRIGFVLLSTHHRWLYANAQDGLAQVGTESDIPPDCFALPP